MLDKSQILKELKEYKNFHTDAAFASFLEISPQNLTAWYKRNTFDENKIVDKFPEVNRVWILTGEGEMIKKPELPTGDPAENVMIPREAWEVIRDQAASLKAKDESLKIKDQQVSEVISLLKEQIKRGEDAEENGHAALGAELG